MKKAKAKKTLIFSCLTLALVMAAIAFSLFSVARTVSELKTEISRSEADVILASAKIDSDTLVDIPVLYYSQVADDCANIYDDMDSTRQFEWEKCGYYNIAFEEGMVEYKLGEDYLPVSIGGEKLPNRNVREKNFKRWFSSVEEKSKVYASKISLAYNDATATFSFKEEDFHPIESNLFTMNLGVPIHVLTDGNETIEVLADDDTWVFIGDTLVLDMGGVHDKMTGRIRISKEGDVYSSIDGKDYGFTGLRLNGESDTIVRIFHANRNGKSSEFELTLKNVLINISNAELAKAENTTVAYDPENPSFIAPLGESLTVRPDRSRNVLAAAISQVVVMGVLMMLFVVITSVVWKYWQYGRSSE